MCTRNQAFEILKIVYHACDPILGHSIHDAILYGSYALELDHRRDRRSSKSQTLDCAYTY